MFLFYVKECAFLNGLDVKDNVVFKHAVNILLSLEKCSWDIELPCLFLFSSYYFFIIGRETFYEV